MWKSLGGLTKSLSGLKALLPLSQQDIALPARITEALMDVKDVANADNSFLSALHQFTYLDPTQPNTMKPIRKNKAFKDAVVFMVGGGNYVEFHSLQELAKVILIMI